MSIEVAFSRGTHTINVGDKFFSRIGTKPGHYVVRALHGLEDHDGKRSVSSYSPSGLFGTPTIGCENLRTGEIVDFCGDSVALLLAYPETPPDDWDEDEARKRNARLYKQWLSNAAKT